MKGGIVARIVLPIFAKALWLVGLSAIIPIMPTKAAVIFENFPTINTGTSVTSSSVFQTFVYYWSQSEETVNRISWLGYGGLENDVFEISIFESVSPFSLPEKAPVFQKISTPDSSISHPVSGYLYTEDLNAGFKLEADQTYQISIWSRGTNFTWLEGKYRCCTITYNSSTDKIWSQGMYPAFGLYSSDSTNPAVPEPLTWALMLVGFGMIGTQLRRRHALHT